MLSCTCWLSVLSVMLPDARRWEDCTVVMTNCNMLQSYMASTAAQSLNPSFCHKGIKKGAGLCSFCEAGKRRKAIRLERQGCLRVLQKDLWEDPGAPACLLILHNKISRPSTNFLLKEPSLAAAHKGISALLKCQHKHLKPASHNWQYNKWQQVCRS